ncbi:Hypothetical protein DIP0404 [Corynebacterium diphtheriae]|uniref:Uncharacterized protein n=1 Tax=Corynebacterium diphtheriae (strain ATCC 700971 / NCTC 13129 / Biotype gravis) TaxID=257309 RepID=Q6NJJ7_CORDI|nr:Hypothetical protein DIP0404 [Corynebacterium diphtheriae]
MIAATPQAMDKQPSAKNQPCGIDKEVGTIANTVITLMPKYIDTNVIVLRHSCANRPPWRNAATNHANNPRNPSKNSTDITTPIDAAISGTACPFIRFSNSAIN